MPPVLRRGAGGVALVFLLAPAYWHLRTIAALFRRRMAYPLDLEWMESCHLYHAYRIEHHLPLYIDPSRGFATFPYPPLHWVVLAAVGKVLGLDWWTGRALSVACIVGASLVCGVLLVRRAPTRWIGASFAIVAAASIAAGYPLTGGSYDLVRPDALATFVPILAAVLVAEGRLSLRRSLLAAAALAATVYVKQTGVFFVGWLVVFAVLRDRRSGLFLAATTAAACLATLLGLSLATEGWFWTWLFDMRKHALLVDTWADPIAPFVRHAPFLLFLPLAVASLRRRGWLSAESVKWTGVLGAALVGAMLAHAKDGSWLNVYTPVFVLAWPVGLLLVCDALRGLWPQRRRALAVAWAVVVASSGALLLLKYDPTRFEPTPKMWESANRFHQIVADLDGEAVVTTIPFAAVRDGKHCTQPILQGYIDGVAAGMPLDFVEGLHLSGARYVVVAGMNDEQHLPLATRFDLVRWLDFDLDTPGVARPYRGTVWRRREPGPPPR